MSSTQLLPSYTISVAHDADALRMLSILYREGALGDEELKSKSLCDGAKYLSKVRELFKSKLIAPEQHQRWAVTASARYVLNLFNVPEISARSLVDEIGAMWSVAASEKSRMNLFFSYASNDEDYFEGVVGRLQCLRELVLGAAASVDEISIVGHSRGTQLLWSLLVDPASVTRSQEHKTLIVHHFEDEPNLEAKNDVGAMAAWVDLAFDNVTKSERVLLHFAGHGIGADPVGNEDASVIIPTAAARVLVFIDGVWDDNILEECVRKEKNFGSVFLSYCQSRDSSSYHLLRKAVLQKYKIDSHSAEDIGVRLNELLSEKVSKYSAAKSAARRHFFVSSHAASIDIEQDILPGLPGGGSLQSKD